MPFYAVRRGKKPGIYNTWDECNEQVARFPRPEFRKFKTQAEAQAFVDGTVPVQKTVQTKSNRFEAKRNINIPVDELKRSMETLTTKKIPSNDDDDDDSPVTNRNDENDVYEVVYSDGCCFGNGSHRSRAGFGVYWGDHHPWNASQRLSGDQTNQRAELTAAIHAMKTAIENRITHLEIRTDSKYTIQSATEWIPGWKRNNWIKKTDSKPVMNKDLMVEIDELQTKVKVKWTYVPGHSSNKGNDEADRLAKAGANKI